MKARRRKSKPSRSGFARGEPRRLTSIKIMVEWSGILEQKNFGLARETDSESNTYS